LTVIADAAAAAQRQAQRDRAPRAVLTAAAAEARSSVDRTPDLLPVLKEAGVVDSGGLGLALILEGYQHYLDGKPLDETGAESPPPAIQGTAAKFEAVHASGLGYCTEFMIEGEELQRAAVRGMFEEIGESVLVVGDPHLLRIHVHATDPGAALSLGVRLGSLSRIKIDNIESQHRALIEGQSKEEVAVSIVAVAIGAGFEGLFREYGAQVIPGGQTFNPSTQEIVAACTQAPGAAIIVLPNNRNIHASAEQAGRLTAKPVTVLETKSMPEGIACLLAFNPERTLEENTKAMREAMADVRTAEITRAARDVSIFGVRAQKGQPIVLVDGSIVGRAESPAAAAAIAVDLISGGSETVTLYRGEAVSATEAEEVARNIQSRHSDLHVELVAGGQPHYDYIVSAE
jgi:fatty acid kinase